MNRPTSVINLHGQKHRESLLRDPSFVYVGRRSRNGWPGSKWANPFKVDSANAVQILHTLQGKNPDPVKHVRFGIPLGSQDAVRLFSLWIVRQPELMDALPELRGKVLGCWCCNWSPGETPEKPCHAVVLARLADGVPWEGVWYP